MRNENKGKKKFIINYQKFYRRTALIAYDIISIVASSFLALLFRYDFNLGEVQTEFLIPVRNFLGINILLTIFIFYLFRLYNSLWAFAGETELQNLVLACLTSSVVTGIGVNFFRLEGMVKAVPDSYYFGYFFFLLLFMFASRFSYRFLRSQKHKRQNRKNSVSVMIIGAGEAGNTIIKEIITSNYSPW